jgi:uncharacterized protein (DUF2252 family)
MMTANDRNGAGKALRDRVPRTAHAGWKAPANRRDPVAVLIQSSQGRVPELIPIRYGRMQQSPFAFYRGAAALMAMDLARTPVTRIHVQACGDAHLMNFGGFATPERHIVFDINDFDETLPAPWEWDVKRLAASVVVACQHNSFSKAETRNIATQCVRTYREHMREYAGMTVLDRWYNRLDVDLCLATLSNRKERAWIVGQIQKAIARTVLHDDFPKLATVQDGEPRIKDNPPLLFHQKDLGLHVYDHPVQHALRRYRSTLPDDRKALFDRYEVKDIAAKVVGVGSVGTRCGILLMMAAGDGEDVLFLQMKEARASVLEPYVGKSRYTNQGQRVVVGQRLMQAASDVFLGWTEERGRCFYLRQLHDVKIKPVADVEDASLLAHYAAWCGHALARAHAKSGDATMISGYLGTNGRFDNAVADFAAAYADQNERDYRAFLKAIRSKRIEAVQE